jgi:hypothetical protein
MTVGLGPDWKIRPMDDCLLWAGILKITEVAHILGYFFPRLRLCITFDKNGLCYILGDFFSQTHPATLVSRNPKLYLMVYLPTRTTKSCRLMSRDNDKIFSNWCCFMSRDNFVAMCE